MKAFSIPAEIKTESSGRTMIECKALGYLTAADSYTEAEQDIRDMLKGDPFFESLEPRVLVVNPVAGEITFDFDVRLLKAILGKVVKTKKIKVTELMEEMGFSSTGSINRNISPKSDTVPRIDTLIDLTHHLGISIRLG